MLVYEGLNSPLHLKLEKVQSEQRTPSHRSLVTSHDVCRGLDRLRLVRVSPAKVQERYLLSQFGRGQVGVVGNGVTQVRTELHRKASVYEAQGQAESLVQPAREFWATQNRRDILIQE